jgi:glucose-6-phosphate isomerase
MLNWQLENSHLKIDGHVVAPTSARSLEQLRPVVQDPNTQGSAEVYRVFRGVDDPDAPPGQRADITIIEPGTIGQEFNKTHGHYHLGEGIETYKVLSGRGMFVLQKPAFNYESVDSARLVKLSPGQSLEVPSGWGHTMVNIGDEPLVAINYELPDLQNLYDPFQTKRGAAFYILKAGGIEVVPNPSYGDLPKPQTF